MIASLKTILQHKCRLEITDSVVLGVSGGPDSVCLLDLLCRAGYPVVVAHFNHRLRPGAESDARFVRRLAESYAVPFVYGEADVAEFAASTGLSIEAAGREHRYMFLFAEAAKSGSQAVVVAHHADDQVETLLLHLLRGAGLTGLAGMRYRWLPNPWSETIPLLRPLLDIWKNDIQAYLKSNDLPSVEDETNASPAYVRNRVRLELIPLLETFNPAARKALWRAANTLREDQEILDMFYDPLWEMALRQLDKDAVALDLEFLRMQPVGVQRALLRRAIACLRPGLMEIGLDLVDRGLSALQQPSASRQCDLGAGLRLVQEQGMVWVARWNVNLPGGSWPQLKPGKSLSLPIPGRLDLAAGWELICECREVTSRPTYESNSALGYFQVWLDVDQVRSPLTVRTRRAGERFCPLGMDGRSLKLSDFMVNVKMPARARAGWPLIFSADELIWVPGYRQNHAARITDNTRSLLILKLQQVKESEQHPVP